MMNGLIDKFPDFSFSCRPLDGVSGFYKEERG
jgi:hypothetical protein